MKKKNKELCKYGKDHNVNKFHTCPYQVDINEDKAHECQCCQECIQDCNDAI